MKIVRPTDWKTSPMPERRTTVALDRGFSARAMARIRAGLLPRQMEDKWFVYWADDTMWFHRSWTGMCIYAVRFEGARAVSALVNRDPGQYGGTDDEHDAAMVSYLIDVLLLRRDAPFPSTERDEEVRALQMWSEVGRAMLGEHPE